MHWVVILVILGVIVLATWLLARNRKVYLRFSSVGPRRFGKAGFSVWSYQGGHWSLVEDRSGTGFKPGQPPVEAGLFEGYCVKVTSIPASPSK